MATCFVIQGFGKKTDFTDGRVLDLDASYAVIKDAVEEAGLTCIRADEIPHFGTIDLPMYQQLLQADLVIADLSTYNINAAFELGVRYGLRDRATIIVAEEQFKNPFDVSHIAIRRYKHLGEDIGVKEAKRFGDDLKQAIAQIMQNREPDSPVYTFLDLVPPGMARITESSVETTRSGAATTTVATISRTTVESGPAPAAVAAPAPAPADGVSAKSLLDDALAHIQQGDFAAAKQSLTEVHGIRPNDSFVVQQLALATYKAGQPDEESALVAARDLLCGLNPATTNDPETLGLWGAIHKRLWALHERQQDLDSSIEGYERGFHLKQDYYNGINLAYLLDVRAQQALKAGEREEGMADAVLAKRTRRQVIRYAEPQLDKEPNPAKKFWLFATLREAAEGLGDAAAAHDWLAKAQALDVPAWMLESSESQIAALRAIQADIAALSPSVTGA